MKSGPLAATKKPCSHDVQAVGSDKLFGTSTHVLQLSSHYRQTPALLTYPF